MPISVRKPPRVPALLAPVRELVTATLALAGLKAGEITVVLESDAALRALNRRWRRIDRATDVLSFPYAQRRGGGTSGPAARIDGDLVISMDRVRAQASRYRVTRGAELARLVIHGTLHLAGHDHHRPAERDAMRRLERAALRSAARPIAKLGALLSARRTS